jgi:hypothetical protein
LTHPPAISTRDIRGDAGCRKRFVPAPIVVDAHDPAVTKGESVEDLALERLASHRADARAAGTQHDLLAAAGELERVDLAALVESPAKGVEHLFAAVADPIFAQRQATSG